MTTRIGWLQDDPGYVGGAELNAQAIREGAPDGIEIVDCKPDMIRTDVDMYVIHNSNSYPPVVIQMLEKKPVVKMMHDVWPHGEPMLKNWILNNAKMIVMVSPKVNEWMKWPVGEGVEVVYAPSPIDSKQFEAAAANSNGRQGNCWMGFFHANKGLIAAAEWAYHQKTRLDAYGWGDMTQVVEPIDYKGKLNPRKVAETLAKYERLVFLPMYFDACPRVIFEAWYAGCEIVTNAKQGASWWIENDPEAIPNAAARFWGAVLS